MNRSIRKQLEGRLSADALDFLNEEFRKHEELLVKLKETQDREKWLTEEICKKDEILKSVFTKSAGESYKQPMGYQYGDLPKEYFFNPEEMYGRKSSVPSFEMRRGGRGMYSEGYIPQVEPTERRYMPFQAEDYLDFEAARGGRGSSTGGSTK